MKIFMEKRFKIFLLSLFLISISFIAKIKAVNIQLNDTIYFLDTKDWGDIYMYIFNSNTHTEAWAWENSEGKMTDTGIDINNHNLYAYTLTNSHYQNKHNTVIFSSKSARKQTKNLSYIKSDILFAPSITDGNTSNYDGEWYIKNKEELKNLVNKALNVEEEKYTKNSYQTLKDILNKKEYSYTSSGYINDRGYKNLYVGVNDVLNTDLVLVTLDGYSVYDDAVNDLKNAINSLVLKNQIYTSSNNNGVISLNKKYFENGENIQFKITPMTGYKTSNITITKIIGYDNNNNPILSTNNNDIKTINPNENNEYSYSPNYDIYISATFNKKTYQITTTLNGNGKIEPFDPITIEYGDDKTYLITANKGYKVKSVLVNGVLYNLVGNKLVLKNIKENTAIVVNFEINSYKITIDGTSYNLTYKSKLTDLKNYENIIKKEGYTFKGFKNKDNNQEYDINHEIDSDINLITIFDKIDKNNNLIVNTGDKIIYSFIGIAIAIIGTTLLVLFRKKTLHNKKNYIH